MTLKERLQALEHRSERLAAAIANGATYGQPRNREQQEKIAIDWAIQQLSRYRDAKRLTIPRTTDDAGMLETILPAQSLVHVNGIPVVLRHDAIVGVGAENATLLTREQVS